MLAPVNKRRALLAAMGAIALIGCSEEKLSPRETYALLSMAAYGFQQHDQDIDGGPVYVMFDPQCSHCRNLWEQTKDIQATRFLWVPVAVISGSRRIAAAILEAKSPASMFEAIKAGQRINASVVSEKALGIIDDNTALLRQFDTTGVPFMVAQRPDGSVLMLQGAHSKPEIKELLGL